MSELLDVLDRPRLARFLDAAMRAEVVSRLYSLSLFLCANDPGD